MSDKRRVVITGCGPVTPVGIGVEDFWSALIEGKSGVGPVERYDAANFPTRIAAEIRNFPAERFFSTKELKRMDLFCQYALAGAILAIEDAGLSETDYSPERIGVIIGSGIGGIETLEKQAEILRDRGPGRLTPFLIPMIIINMASGLVAIRFGYKGPNTCVATACATGTHAIGDAARLIQHGHADAMVAGGAEAAITPLAMGGFCAMKAMSRRNDDPAGASRPFDAGRDGFVMGEGAGIVLLEEYEHARRRGARIYAEVIGYGMTCDANHITAPAPDGSGVAKAMELSIKESGRPLDQFTYINAHGTSTPLNDKFETLAIRKVFGDSADHVMVSSTKSMTGHLIGAAGGIETIVTALVIARGAVPPTINYTDPDPECDLDYVPNEAREAAVEAALNNNLGFGGHNAVIALGRV
ncbi:MAG: beta-ketoacyl-[acyl-carrier-protein] synthase II [Candidatus Hydrogenedentota bacterium]|nr:MAG: beta-ketoacyl-[acyl-carrier-protein] synthase II [Candidatus Hydrogenedentota bacterium]